MDISVGGAGRGRQLGAGHHHAVHGRDAGQVRSLDTSLLLFVTPDRIFMQAETLKK